jgi:hypothetical protein
MFEPFLYDRCPVKCDEISRQCGNASIGTLRQIYGLRFAWSVSSNIRLRDALPLLDSVSFEQLAKNHADGSLAGRIAKASRRLPDWGTPRSN